MRSFVIALVLISGCETGTEVAGVSHATIDRRPDGSVVVTATLDCMLAAGRRRADGNCDADDTRVCVDATWLEPKPALETQVCRTVAHIRGATMQLAFAKLPDDARTIVVSTTDQHRVRDPALQRGVTEHRP